ncbi:hypothetical protein EMIT0347P_60190 [Pseudomonas sp. IT-347P]
MLILKHKRQNNQNHQQKKHAKQYAFQVTHSRPLEF